MVNFLTFTKRMDTNIKRFTNSEIIINDKWMPLMALYMGVRRKNVVDVFKIKLKA